MDSIWFNNQCKEMAIRDSCWLKCVCINRKMRQVPPKTKKLSVRFLSFFFGVFDSTNLLDDIHHGWI